MLSLDIYMDLMWWSNSYSGLLSLICMKMGGTCGGHRTSDLTLYAYFLSKRNTPIYTLRYVGDSFTTKCSMLPVYIYVHVNIFHASSVQQCQGPVYGNNGQQQQYF